MGDDVSIRQRFDLGESGDRAEVRRVIRSGRRFYVEVVQTRDAREPTIIVAVNRALDDYERETGIKIEERYGETKETIETG